MSAAIAMPKRERHTVLFDSMVAKLGLVEALGALSDAGAKSDAVDRCMGCSQASACAHWLAETEQAKSSPDYCENTDMFDTLKHQIAAEGLPRR